MKRILLLGTGGTIACLPTDEGLLPVLKAGELLSFLDTDVENVRARDLFALDSSNIQPEEWTLMAAEITRAIYEYDAIVISHGTDTMAYSASMLSFMLTGIRIPVVLTGAQYPIAYPNSDGRMNLKHALISAKKLPGGVYICFGTAVMLGCRAVKVRTISLNAFESINYPYIGTVANDAYIHLHTPHVCDSPFSCNTALEPNVALIKLVPGTSAALFHALFSSGYKGLVVEAFGLGGVHSIRRDHTEAIAALIQSGMPVVLTSQCLYEESTPNVYEVSRALADAGVISARDMTSEAAVTKLMWALGQTSDMQALRDIMTRSLAGEITAECASVNA